MRPNTFNARSTAKEVVAGKDLQGKIAIITGASSGLGIEAARALAEAGARVVLAVRDIKKGQQVADEITEGGVRGSLEVMELELSSYESVRRFAQAFLAKNSALHFLINNAGIMGSPLSRNEAGHEMQFATNHLGHFLLTGLLMGALERGAPSRVVVYSSIGHAISGMLEDWNFETTPYDTRLSYGQSKSANALFALELNRRYQDRGVQSFSVHPGGIMTGLQKHMPRERMIAMGWMDAEGNINPAFKTPEQGASTAVWAATADDLTPHGGAYLADCQVSQASEHARDPQIALKLWELSQNLVNLRY